MDRTLRQLRHGALSLLQIEAAMPRRVGTRRISAQDTLLAWYTAAPKAPDES